VLRGLLRAACLALVRLFYPHRRVVGRERVPEGPLILVANHTNSLVDPLLLRIALGREIRFLAKSTFFDRPLGRFAMTAFGSIPVHRSQDHGPAEAAGASRNEATFALCRAALARGEWLALFPEGTSHSDSRMRPLKTGAARIALGAAQSGIEIQIVPVGLVYEAKAIFRSGVLLVFGAPLSVEAYRPEYRNDARREVEQLTRDMAVALGEVVLQAETRDLLEGVARVAGGTAFEGPPQDPGRLRQRVDALLAAYGTLHERDAERARRIVRAARDYARVLAHLGVRDPWALEIPRVQPLRAVLAVAKLALTAPLALVGVALWWAPYRLAGRVAPGITRGEEDMLGTVKILAGCLFITVTWIVEMTAAGLIWGWPGLGATALCGPVGGYAAMRWPELAGDTAEAFRQLWLSRAPATAVHRVVARRRALANDVVRALDEIAEG
jgi:glycerol-3-phosphate O-acyltransferase/dihydroxyacetone phosphate acyltransferase